MPDVLALIEFPADDPARARSFWSGLLEQPLPPRAETQGEGWQTAAAVAPAGGGPAAVGVHARGRGPGDSFSLPYFSVEDMAATLARVPALGGSIVHPGERWSICKDSEGNPFGLALGAPAGAERAAAGAERAGAEPPARAGTDGGDPRQSRLQGS
jgi:predicted enzyme related to lactoylglutathione lyase